MENKSLIAFILEDKYEIVPCTEKNIYLSKKYKKQHPVVHMRTLRKNIKAIEMRFGGSPVIPLGRGIFHVNGEKWMAIHIARAPA